MQNDRRLRQRILIEKERLQYETIFTSVRYIKMLKSISREITDVGFDNIHVIFNSVNGIAGSCSVERIVIYICNALTRSYPTIELKNRSLVGILGHECGHKNYSNPLERKKYLEGIQEGSWYPQPPIPENKVECESIKEMKEYFENKDRVALSVIYSTASYIQNELEDIYTEEKMCSRFPGSVKTGILQNRSRKLEQIPSLREQIKCGYGNVAILVNLISQYTLCGRINNWDGYQGEILDVLDTVKQTVDQAVSDDRSIMRINATNKILLKIWKYLREEIEEIKEKQEENNGETNNEEEKKSEEETLEKFIQQFSSQIPGFIKDSDTEWNGSWEVDVSQMNESEPDVGKGIEQSNVQETTYLTVAKESAMNADDQLQRIIFEKAKKCALHSIHEDNMIEMNRELEKMEFQEGHREVKKVLLRNENVGERTLREKSMEIQVQRVTQRLNASVLPILRMKENRNEHKLMIGKKIDTRYITNQNGKIFQKKHFQGQDNETAVGILIDMSESMSDKRIEAAKIATLCIHKFCRMAKIPVMIYGHHTDGYRHTNLSKECVFLHSCAEFEPDENDRYRILDLKVNGANRDGAALIYIGTKLLQRPERQKILLLISDGLPNSNYYNGDEAKNDLMKIKRDLGKKGITFLAAAIGEDKKAIEEIYQEAFLDISDLERMPAVLSKKLLSLIRRI